jgi:hypothetical protein
MVFPGNHPSYLSVRGKKAAFQRTYSHIGKKREKAASYPPPNAARFDRPEEKKAEHDSYIKNAAQDRDVPLIPRDFNLKLTSGLATRRH